MEINYRIDAINVLLNEDCILTRYYPLIPYKEMLTEYFTHVGCPTKNECIVLSNEELLLSGLPDINTANLFRRFLALYDVNPQKFKEIESICQASEESDAFHELYMLPGVKATRAMLYFKSGYRTLKAIASSSVEEIISKAEEVIKEERPDLKVPLVKEVKTHIAVAKAFTFYNVD